MNTITLTVSELVSADPEAAFDAWLDTKRPGGPWFGVSSVVLDAKVGGLFHHTVEHAGKTWAHYGRFIALERPSRIEHTWMSEATRGIETVVTLTFDKAPEGTRVTLKHSSVPDDAMGRQHEDGWKWVLSTLAQRFVRHV